jgi:hypothetical protein
LGGNNSAHRLPAKCGRSRLNLPFADHVPQTFSQRKGGTMAVTKDKLASLLFFAATLTLAVALLPALGVPGFGILIAIVVSFAGLMLIWFAEPLSEAGCFSRGVPHSSPPRLIEGIGWLFLVGYPVLLVWLIRTAPVWTH